MLLWGNTATLPNTSGKEQGQNNYLIYENSEMSHVIVSPFHEGNQVIRGEKSSVYLTWLF